MIETIQIIFSEMVQELQKTKTKTLEPNRYYAGASISEANLVYHFVKQLEKRIDKCAVYLEFPCDSGRIDAVVLYENNILLIEAKTQIDNKKYKVLNAQATRFENIKDNFYLKSSDIEDREEYLRKYFQDSSLRDTLSDRIKGFFLNKWNTENEINIFGLLLADTTSEFQKNKWNCEYNEAFYAECKLDCMKTYSMLEESNNNNNKTWYLGAYKALGKL